MSASCGELDAPVTQFMTPQLISVHKTNGPDIHFSTQDVRVQLHNVPARCEGSAMRTPCAAASDDARPALFWCAWISRKGKEHVSGPHHASAEQVTFGGQPWGARVSLLRPAPSAQEVTQLEGVDLNSPWNQLSVRLEVRHGFVSSRGNATVLPFEGPPGGDDIAFYKSFESCKAAQRRLARARVASTTCSFQARCAAANRPLRWCPRTATWARAAEDGCYC